MIFEIIEGEKNFLEETNSLKQLNYLVLFTAFYSQNVDGFKFRFQLGSPILFTWFVSSEKWLNYLLFPELHFVDSIWMSFTYYSSASFSFSKFLQIMHGEPNLLGEVFCKNAKSLSLSNRKEFKGPSFISLIRSQHILQELAALLLGF